MAYGLGAGRITDIDEADATSEVDHKGTQTSESGRQVPPNLVRVIDIVPEGGPLGKTGRDGPESSVLDSPKKSTSEGELVRRRQGRRARRTPRPVMEGDVSHSLLKELQLRHLRGIRVGP